MDERERKKKEPQIIAKISELLKHETAGDPMSGLKWTRKTMEKISEQLAKSDTNVSPNTVARLLKDLGYSLRVNHKKRESGNRKPPTRKIRDQQFNHVSSSRKKFAQRGDPVISVDSKKKELIGNFKNNGTSWQQVPYEVNDHDFPSDAEGKAIPYCIYDTVANRGFVTIGTSHETPAFAVDSIVWWWKVHGSKMYPDAQKILILADCGGGNSARSRVWKYQLQHQLCVPYQLNVTVCHYPPGASKWNPVEHRLLSEISKNWAGKPLESYETALNYIRTTQTTTGLKVNARINRRHYPTGESVADRQMDELNILKHKKMPKWNYSLSPSTM